MAKSIAPSKIKYTTLYPTSLLVNGLDKFGYELAKSLTEQGGYVIIVDNLEREAGLPEFSTLKNTAFIDFVGVADMVEEIRRLDYIFYLNHSTFSGEVEFSSQEFLATSSYMNQILNLAVEFEALFTLTNSIRAHKQLLSMDRFTGKLLQGASADVRPYTEAEFVRYAENLVLEYKKNKGIMAKIVRMGELLGEGIELDRETQVGKLVWAAINSQDLYLDQDGLETEYYVHILDAVYGVLKAQFTKDAKEAVYTLAYPEPLTQLSLAYKIQEFELEAGEIKFIDEDDTKVRLDLPIYKAATNLSKIGWQPRVDLNTALMQSIAYAKRVKAYLLDKKNDVKASEAESVQEDHETIAAGGALARLIAERKQHELINKDKLQSGVAEMEMKKRNVPWHTTLRRRFIKWFDRFKQNFAFLQQVTLLESVIYAVLIGIFLFIFMTLLSPLMVLVRDFALLDRDIKVGIEAADSGNWPEFKERAESARKRVNSIDETVTNADILFTLIQRDELRAEILALNQSMGFYIDSMSNFADSVEQTEKYYKNAGGELVFRPTNASVLSYSQDDQATANQVDVIRARNQNDIALRSLDNSDKIYKQLNRSVIPSFILGFVDDVYGKQGEFRAAMAVNENALIAASNLAQDDYALGILVEDNIRSTYGGGTVTSIGVLEFSGGKLLNIRFLPVHNASFKSTNLTVDELAAIRQLSKGAITSSNNTNARELLKYTPSIGVHNDVAQKAISETFNVEVDTVLTVNTLGFENLLKHYGEIQVNGEIINSSNFLQQINILQDGSSSSRDIVITNIAALLLSKYFNTAEPLSKKLLLVSEMKQDNRLLVDEDFLTSIGETAVDPDIFIAGVTGSTRRFEVNPSIDVNLDSTVTAGQATQKVEINTANAPDIDRVLYCVRKSVSNFDLRGIEPEFYSRVELEDRSCVVFSTDTDNKHTFSYRESLANTKEYKHSIANAPGLGVRYDVEIVYPASYFLAETVPVANRRVNSVFYSGESYSGFEFLLKFN